MSLSIRAIGKAKSVDCDGHIDDESGERCDHDGVASFPLGRERLKAGCYVPGRGGRSFSFEIAYSAYADWFDGLYRMVYGLDASGVCRKFRRHRGKPFIEFVDVPSKSDGQTMGSKRAAKLHGDFVAFARKAKKHFTRSKETAWMWDVYCDFRKAFEIASDGGFVSYW